MGLEGTGRQRGTRGQTGTGGTEVQIQTAAVIPVRDPARLIRRAIASLPQSRKKATPHRQAARAGGAAGGDGPR
jgi:hypothetical protein